MMRFPVRYLLQKASECCEVSYELFRLATDPMPDGIKFSSHHDVEGPEYRILDGEFVRFHLIHQGSAIIWNVCCDCCQYYSHWRCNVSVRIR